MLRPTVQEVGTLITAEQVLEAYKDKAAANKYIGMLDPNDRKATAIRKAYHDFAGECDACREGRYHVIHAALFEHKQSKTDRCSCGKRTDGRAPHVLAMENWLRDLCEEHTHRT